MDLPDSDWGDFSCRRAVDSSSLESVYTENYHNTIPFKSWRPSDTIWRWSGPTWVQVVACCLTVSSHCLNQCWVIINEVLLAFIWGQFHRKCSKYLFLIWVLKITASPRDQWVNHYLIFPLQVSLADGSREKALGRWVMFHFMHQISFEMMYENDKLCIPSGNVEYKVNAMWCEKCPCVCFSLL